MRYAIVSDIHANLAALRAVLDDLGTIERLWCLGDVVGYGPDPNECIGLLRSLPHIAVAGNHDWGVIGEIPLSEFNNDARQACEWTREQLTPANVDYLSQLPTTIVQSDFTLVHGSPREPVWEYLLYPRAAQQNFGHFQTPYCLVGHTHVPTVFQGPALIGRVDGSVTRPFHQMLGLGQAESELPEALIRPEAPLQLGQRRLIINPGSVGQPRDGSPSASYAIYDSNRQTIEYHRVPYPVEETQARMQAAGLSERLINRLSQGW
ncbi:MAG: metallophosphatase family protein [Chloroflexi bacterium]|nr:metallophosphatase family protein [Chloroflexota bacterium]MBU1746067.1 metallophosphatase family protein [Chloroflexota bacterium]